MQNIRVTLKCIAWSGPRLLIFGLKTGGLKGQPGPTRNSYLARLDWHQANVLFAALHPDNVIALSRRYLLQFYFGHFENFERGIRLQDLQNLPNTFWAQQVHIILEQNVG